MVGTPAGPVSAGGHGPVRLGEGPRRLRRGTRMVGDELRQGGSMAELTAGVRAGYDAAAEQWADGPGQMYAQLATVLVVSAPVPLAGSRVLDLGAGAGVAGRAALEAGGRPGGGGGPAPGSRRPGGSGGRRGAGRAGARSPPAARVSALG